MTAQPRQHSRWLSIFTSRATSLAPPASQRLTGTSAADQTLAGLAVRVGWQLPALIAVLATSLYLNLWHLTRNGYGNTYYAAAVRSMSQSWHNFFYNAFDPAGFITVDKPPVALWIQALFVRVFGYSGFTLLLPEALAGAGSVLLVYMAVSRVFGRTAGIVGGLALALTPISVAVNRSNNLDAWLVFFVTFSAYALVRALESGNLRWLLGSAVLMGIAFNTKFLAAYVALPALWFAYIVAAPVSLRRRVLHLAVATVVLAIVSGAWVAAFDLTPASLRPYAGGSSTNSMLNLLIDYNGLGRIDGGESGPATGAPGLLRLFQGSLAGQAMWLTPLALIGGLVALLAAGRRLSGNQRLGSLIVWGGWLITAGVVFSFAQGIFHDYYLSFLGPPVAALAGIGIVSFARSFKSTSRLALLAPVALVATAALEVVVLGYTPGYKTWLEPAVVVPAVAAAAVLLVIAIRRRPSTRLMVAALGLGVAAVLLPTAVWSNAVTSLAANGTLPTASPAGTVDGGGFGGGPGGQGAAEQQPPAGATGFERPNGVPGAGEMPRDGQTPPASDGGGQVGQGGGRGDQGQISDALLDYLRANRGDARYLVAVQSSMQASSTIIATGEPVMAMGGFSGSDPAMTVEQLARLVEQGDLRYVLVSGGGNTNATPVDGSAGDASTTAARPDDGGNAPTGGGFNGGPGGGNSAVNRVVQQVGKVVAASEYGGSSGGGTLYDLQGLGDAIRTAGGS